MNIICFYFFVCQMPYKVVQIQKKNGKLELAAVPSGWEEDGTLYWPATTCSSALLHDAESVPKTAGGKWQRYNCSVKRLNLPSYEKASAEIDVMENQSDTCASGGEEAKKPPPGTQTVMKREKRRVCSVAKNPDSQRNNFNEVVSIYISIHSMCIFLAKLCDFDFFSLSPNHRLPIWRKKRDHRHNRMLSLLAKEPSPPPNHCQ